MLSRPRRSLVSLVAAVAAVVLVTVPQPAQATDPVMPTPSYLFTVEASGGTTKVLKPRGSTERMRITLNGVEPVTMFADRPLRNARLISPAALTTNWPTWFADSPPNAVMTWSAGAGKAPASFVVTLMDVDFNAATGQLTFTAERDPRKHDPAEKGRNWQRLTTPAAFTEASLFIDNAGSRVVNGCTLANNASCPGADLSGGNLSYLGPLMGVNLQGATLANANMYQAVFGNSNFTGADFTGTDLRSTVFGASKLDNITARYVRWGGDTTSSSMTHADLAYSDFSYGHYHSTDFSYSNLAVADFTYADLSYADFTGANLVGADFTGATIDETAFYGADLTGAIITGLSYQMTDPSTTCPNGLPGFCAPWAPGPDDLPVDQPSGKGDWVCTTISVFDPYQMKKVPYTECKQIT